MYLWPRERFSAWEATKNKDKKQSEIVKRLRERVNSEGDGMK